MNDIPPDKAASIFQARTVHGIPPTEHQVEYENILHLLSSMVERYGEKTWLIFHSESTGRHEYSYRQFFELVCRTANLLIACGIKRGDRISTIAYNHADTMVQYFAAWAIGAAVVPVNVAEEDRRIAYILNNAGSKLAFVRDEYIERIERLQSEVPLLTTLIPVGSHDGVPRGDSIMEQHPDLSISRVLPTPDALPRTYLEDEALIVYTSGTTGNPKGVVLTQYNLIVDAKAIVEWHGLTASQRLMCVLPIHHVNGIVVTMVAPLFCGGSVVLNQKFHSHRFFELIAAERVSIVSVVPTLLQFLLHENTFLGQFDLTQFRHIICGAGPLTVELATRFEERYGLRIIHGYGLSETTCYSCFLPLDLSSDTRKRWLSEWGFPSIGVPVAANEMAIQDELGNPVAENKRGEIVIRGHNVMKGYFADEEANRRAFAGGWFRTGDEGFSVKDSHGRQYFFITGRIKELIIRGGVNISPFEIDEVLMNMPGVKAGLSVGFENDWYGEEVGAYIQPTEGSRLSEQEVLDYCCRFLPSYKSPKVVIFGDDVPVTATGKYQRNKLKPLFAKWKAVQFPKNIKR